MPKMHVSVSAKITASPQKLFSIVSDFQTWKEWSPWLILEPGIRTEIAKDGQSYSWAGELVGSGEMKIVRKEEKRKIAMDLLFLKPYRSQARVGFHFHSRGQETEITWTMDGGLPFFMFWMKKMMISLIEMDYERGLSMLKDYAETGSVPTKLDVEGVQAFPARTYVGIRKICPTSESGPAMAEAFGKLGAWAEGNGKLITGEPFSVYNKWDMKNKEMEFTSAFPVSSVPEQLPDGFCTGELPELKTHNILHTGAYRHLGNAWTLGMMQSRAKTFRKNREFTTPVETYVDDPGSTTEESLRTRLHFPAL